MVLTAGKRLVSGIDKIAKAVKSTLGPRGNTVLIESPTHTHGITVTKDGVTVAKSISLLDAVENLAVIIMKEAADKTSATAGDGTTTAIVLTQALVKSGIERIDPKDNSTEIFKEMVNITNGIVKKLKEKSKPVNKTTLKHVATISSNNDVETGKIIADVYNKVGKNGIVTVEKSQSADTYFESTEGIKVERGYSSNLFVNNHKKDECLLDDAHVLVSDAEISNILTIENVLKPIIQEGKRLLIIAPCSTNVINTLAANVMKNGLKVCVVQPPNFGWKQHELMQDIALSVGATYFSEKTGDDLSIINYNDLGIVSKVISSRDSTILINNPDRDTTAIDKRVEELWDAHKNTEKKLDKEFILSRIASLTGGIGVIYVGGNTDLEQKELYDRVDDAVCAVRSAMTEGILPGSGVALYNITNNYLSEIEEGEEFSGSKKIACAILKDALASPLSQILENAGEKLEEMYKPTFAEGFGFDVKNGKYGDLIKLGVIDPMKVTKSALQNAVSVAVTILSTNAIVTMARTVEKE